MITVMTEILDIVHCLSLQKPIVFWSLVSPQSSGGIEKGDDLRLALSNSATSIGFPPFLFPPEDGGISSFCHIVGFCSLR
jgi:hypothetical protein